MITDFMAYATARSLSVYDNAWKFLQVATEQLQLTSQISQLANLLGILLQISYFKFRYSGDVAWVSAPNLVTCAPS